MRHDPGLAASPPLRYILKVERSVYAPSACSALVRITQRDSPGPAWGRRSLSGGAACRRKVVAASLAS